MTASHLAALVQRLHPDTAVRHLSREAGLDDNRLGYFLKPGTVLTRMPTTDVIADLARALGCAPVEVTRALAADLKLTWSEPITEDDRTLIDDMHRLPEREQHAVRLMAASLLLTADNGTRRVRS